ncbi:MAG: hypothetical protein K2L10_06920 [Ruminococcus sp.]|nr:hypothetical protein [Ruminococcus sp.]
MTGMFILLISALLLLVDVIAFITANKLYAGRFIRKIRYFVYSLTPARRIFVIVVFGAVCVITDFSFQNTLLVEILLLSGMWLTYSGKLFTLRQKKKRRLPAKKVKQIRQKKG